MPIDPNILMQGAQMQIASRNQLGNDLTNAIKIYQDSKTKGFDLKKLAEQGLYEYSATGKTTPERLAAIQALDTLEGPKTTYSRDESGALVPTTQPSIMDRISQIGPKQYTPSFPPLGAAPVGQTPAMPEQPTGALNAIPALSMDQLEQPMPRMGGMPPAALTQQQQDALNARGDVMNISAPALPQITAPAGAGPKTIQAAQEANVDVQKTLATEAGKKAIELQSIQPKMEARLTDLGLKMQTVNSAIDKAITQSGSFSAGFGGGFFGDEEKGYTPGTPAANLAATLKTIKADAAFSELQKMRDNSPTGGALGGIAVQELELLQNAQAALSQSQSPSQLSENLKNYKNVRNRSLLNVRDAFVQQYGYEPDMTKYGVPPIGSIPNGYSKITGNPVVKLPNGKLMEIK